MAVVVQSRKDCLFAEVIDKFFHHLYQIWVPYGQHCSIYGNQWRTVTKNCSSGRTRLVQPSPSEQAQWRSSPPSPQFPFAFSIAESVWLSTFRSAWSVYHLALIHLYVLPPWSILDRRPTWNRLQTAYWTIPLSISQTVFRFVLLPSNCPVSLFLRRFLLPYYVPFAFCNFHSSL